MEVVGGKSVPSASGKVVVKLVSLGLPLEAAGTGAPNKPSTGNRLAESPAGNPPQATSDFHFEKKHRISNAGGPSPPSSRFGSLRPSPTLGVREMLPGPMQMDRQDPGEAADVARSLSPSMMSPSPSLSSLAGGKSGKTGPPALKSNQKSSVPQSSQWKASAVAYSISGQVNNSRGPASAGGGALRKLSQRSTSSFLNHIAMPGEARGSFASTPGGSRHGSTSSLHSSPRGSQSSTPSESPRASTRGSSRISVSSVSSGSGGIRFAGRKTLLALPGSSGSVLRVPGQPQIDEESSTVTTINVTSEALLADRKDLKRQRQAKKKMTAFSMKKLEFEEGPSPAESTMAFGSSPALPVPASPSDEISSAPPGVSDQNDERQADIAAKERQDKSSSSSSDADSDEEEEKPKEFSKQATDLRTKLGLSEGPQKGVTTSEKPKISKPKPKPRSVEEAHGAPTMELLKTMQRKLKAAAYTKGGVDWEKLFREVDKDNSGLIDFKEFLECIRKAAKIKKNVMSDKEVRHIFEYIDKDGSQEIDYRREFIPWIQEEEFLGSDESDEEPQQLRGSRQDVMRMSVWSRPRDVAKLRAVFNSTRQQLVRFKEDSERGSQTAATKGGLKGLFQKAAGAVQKSFNQINTAKALLEVWREYKSDKTDDALAHDTLRPWDSRRDSRQDMQDVHEGTADKQAEPKVDEKLCWPRKGILTVRLIRACGLSWFDPFPNPYVVLSLGPTKFQTKTMEMQADPVWDQPGQERQFLFMVRPEDGHNILWMKVYSEQTTKQDSYLGYVEIPLIVVLSDFKWGEWKEMKLKLHRDRKDTDPMTNFDVDNRGEFDIQLKMDNELSFAEAKERRQSRKKTIKWGTAEFENFQKVATDKDMFLKRKSVKRATLTKANAPQFHTEKRSAVKRATIARARLAGAIKFAKALSTRVKKSVHDIKEEVQALAFQGTLSTASASSSRRATGLAGTQSGPQSGVSSMRSSHYHSPQTPSSTSMSRTQSMADGTIALHVDRLLERIQQLSSCFEDRLGNVEQIDQVSDGLTSNANQLVSQMRKSLKEASGNLFGLGVEEEEEESSEEDSDEEEHTDPYLHHVHKPPSIIREESLELAEVEEDGVLDEVVELDAEDAVAMVADDLKQLAAQREKEVISAQADLAEMRIAQTELKEILQESFPDMQGFEEITDFVSDEVVERLDMLSSDNCPLLEHSIQSMKGLQIQLKEASSAKNVERHGKRYGIARKSLSTKTITPGLEKTFQLSGVKVLADEDTDVNKQHNLHMQHRRGRPLRRLTAGADLSRRHLEQYEQRKHSIVFRHRSPSTAASARMTSPKGTHRDALKKLGALQEEAQDPCFDFDDFESNWSSIEWTGHPWDLSHALKTSGWPRALAAPLQKLAMFRRRKMESLHPAPLKRTIPCGPVVTKTSSLADVVPSSACSSTRGLEGTRPSTSGSSSRVRLTQFLNASTSSDTLLSWIQAGAPSDTASSAHSIGFSSSDFTWSETHWKKGMSGWFFMKPARVGDESSLGTSQLSMLSTSASTGVFQDTPESDLLCHMSTSVLNSPGPRHIHMKTAKELDEMNELETLVKQSALYYLSTPNLQRPGTGPSSSLSSLIGGSVADRKLSTR